MKRVTRLVLLIVICGTAGPASCGDRATVVKLPAPRLDGDLSLETVLQRRRSVRDYTANPLALADLGQLLWAAQGVTSPRGFRTAPSAGALYPLEVYAVVGAVEGLEPGVYRYEVGEHALQRWRDGDRRAQLAEAALNQEVVGDAAVVLAFTAVEARTARKYGRRAMRYALIETGHAAQNVLLQAEALNLGAVVVGAVHDRRVEAVLESPPAEEALYLLAVGRRKS